MLLQTESDFPARAIATVRRGPIAGARRRVCFVNKRRKFFKDERKQTEPVWCLNKVHI